MGGSSSSANDKFPLEKSDDEWRAVLSPEQVLPPQANHKLTRSFVFSEKRARNGPERVNMNILKVKACLIVRDVVLHYTKLHLNLIPDVDGLLLPRGTFPNFIDAVILII
jgi:hypothetical protein